MPILQLNSQIIFFVLDRSIRRSTSTPQNPATSKSSSDSNSCCGHITLIKVSLLFDGVLLCAIVAVIVYLLLVSQRTGNLENDIVTMKGATAELQG